MASLDLDAVVQEPWRSIGIPLRDGKLVPLRDVMLGDVRPIMLMLLSGAALLLLIACINVVSLLLARSDSRTTADRLCNGNARRACCAADAAVRDRAAPILVIAAAVLGLTLATWGTRLLGGLLAPT